MLLFFNCLALASRCVSADVAEWVPLFNGKDLSGWETFLGRANPGETNYGLNFDPEKVFSVDQVDGGPVIHISGKYWGGLITTQEFANYHLRLEYKWGDKTWPPRVKSPRDSGICYHCVGPLAADPIYPWPRSFEFNIAEHDVGEFWSVDYAMRGILICGLDAVVLCGGTFARGEAAHASWKSGNEGNPLRLDKRGS